MFLIKKYLTLLKGVCDTFTGFDVTSVPFDGNCQFNAIALQLGIELDVKSSNIIRQQIVDHLRTYKVSRLLKAVAFAIGIIYLVSGFSC
jgi:hypothetical protein